MSLLIAIGIAFLALPLFNSLSGKTMALVSLFSPVILPLLIALPFAVGLLAGSYPAFFLSAFKPIEVLKGRLKAGTRAAVYGMPWSYSSLRPQRPWPGGSRVNGCKTLSTG